MVGNVFQIGGVCRDDGAANRWAGLCSLGYWPSAYRAALPDPTTLIHRLRLCAPVAVPENHFVPSRSTYSHLLGLHHTYSTISPPFPLCSYSKSSGGGWWTAKPGHNPLIFLHVVTASADIPLFSLHLPCCAGWMPGLQSQARSHMLQLYFLTCSRAPLAKLPLQGSRVYSINTLSRARNHSDYGRNWKSAVPLSQHASSPRLRPDHARSHRRASIKSSSLSVPAVCRARLSHPPTAV